MKIKWVDYAYPSSTYAKRFGFNKVGCFVVLVADSSKELPKAILAYKTEQEAIDSANLLTNQWWSVYVKQGRKIA